MLFNRSKMDVPDFEDFAAAMTRNPLEGDDHILEMIINDLAPYDIYDVISRIPFA